MATKNNRLLFNTHEVAEQIGRHPNDVLRLIRQGAIEARRMNIRGTKGKGQWVVTARELERFVESLPTAAEDVRPPRQSRKRRSPGAGEVIEIC